MPMSAECTFVHPALFYRTPAEYLAGTVPFVTGALEAGEPVAVAVPPANLELLRRELGADADRVHLLDMTRVGRNPGRIIPGVLRAFADAHSGVHVRIIGEPIWAGRSEAEYPACVQHEALINHAFDGRRVTILCPYDTASLGPVALADAVRTHPWLVDGAGEWRASGAYSPDDVVADYNRELPEPADAAVLVVDPNGLRELRKFVAETAVRAGLDEDRAHDVVLAVTELASNSVEHARSDATVLLGRGGGQLVCQVRDRGHIADPLAGRRPEVPGQPRGRGLLLVNHLVDLVRVHTTPAGTTVEVRFELG
ncbi:anti-sigma factor RsbA family regulatory protein [Amycolatopsis sp. cmx-4-68]|uniref:anti-sigma factor RsbA family regulatory protein n=1 Tax=Amycolatopsis sp. cmx-4-68 TaxID=2790938 RepID=UPI003979829C